MVKIYPNRLGLNRIVQYKPRQSAVTIGSICASLLLSGAIGCRTGQSTGAIGRSTQHLDFNQDVQPILASNCFSCHGPDPEMRKAGLRLDLQESAFKVRPGHPDAIVPNHPELSELVKRIESKDPHHLMPQSPQGEAKPMRAEDIAILKEWVKEGAQYRPHWAFEKPVRAPVPAVQDAAWNRDPIDSFLLAGMKKEGLAPSPEADKRTLIRRVTLDLTGLLPTPQEVDAFVQDTSAGAYERLVDGLLARPSFGEERTRYWLDYARYADTYGLHFDNNRHAWPYRDYLIRVLQYQQAVRSICDGADRRRHDAGEKSGSPDCERICAVGDQQQRGRDDPGGVACESGAGAHGSLRSCLHGSDRWMRRLSRSQVRPDYPEGLLFTQRFLQQYRGTAIQ